MAEQQVGRRPRKQGKPVGGEPIDEGGQEGVAAVDTGQDQQTAQAGLDDAEPARSDGDERDDVRGGVRQKHQGGPGIAAGGAQGRQQAAEVKAEPAGGQQDRPPPVPAQDRPDRVALGQQPGVQAGQLRAATASDPVSQAFGGAAYGSQRAVGTQDDGAEDGNKTEPGDPDEGAMDEPGAGRRANAQQ